MLTDKESKHIRKILEGSSLNFLFPAWLNTEKISGQYMIATDKLHMIGIPGAVEVAEGNAHLLPADNAVQNIISGQYVPLLLVDAKELRKALRSLRALYYTQIQIGESVTLATSKSAMTDVLPGIDVPVLEKLTSDTYAIYLIKSQWMSILSLMEGTVEVGVILGDNYGSWYFLEKSRGRFGISMLQHVGRSPFAQFAHLSAAIYRHVAKEEFKRRHSAFNSTLSWNEARDLAEVIDWDFYRKLHYAPEAAAYERLFRYTDKPAALKAAKVLIHWDSSNRRGGDSIIVKRNGKARRYHLSGNTYNRRAKIERILEYWGYIRVSRWNRDIKTGNSVLYIAPDKE